MKQAKLGICLIGCGRAGMIHARNFFAKVPGAYMAAVVDVSQQAAQAASQELGGAPWYLDYRDAILSGDVDAVIVVSPTDMHRQIVTDCAAKGKHILCEKPMGMNTGECEAMLEACQKHNVRLQLGFMRRFDASFRQAKALLDSGAVGELVLIHSCTRGPSKPQPWMYDLNKSNGILAEVNSHDIDAVRWFAGSEIERLYAIGGNYRSKEVAAQYPDYYDSVIMNGRFQNGVQFCIDGAAYIQYGYDSRMELVGTKGTIRVGRSQADFVQCVTVENGASTPFIASWRTLFEQAYLAEDIAFAECCVSGEQPLVSGLDGKMAVSIVEAGNRSIRTGEVVLL